MSAWKQVDTSFADVADRIRAAMNSAREDDLRAKHRMGLAAYERSMVARGMSASSARIFASAVPLFADLYDD